ncbi:FMN-dependent NADH-azoreductase [Madurella mycetomatis]|uniref:FMN-dependent NADH-azoreductase n=1 Tax=Madurella mycetomatis TaxID=100816 RepID=A0A175VSS6_9PEZI|nr:FMN-dependent NADH-azoreductase [Madurella mycetomatis]
MAVLIHGASTELVDNRHFLPLGPGKTDHALRATCTDGVPASKQHSAGYPFDNYTVVIPAENWTSYKIRKGWYAEHFVSGPHYLSSTHNSDPYGYFKC